MPSCRLLGPERPHARLRRVLAESAAPVARRGQERRAQRGYHRWRSHATGMERTPDFLDIPVAQVMTRRPRPATPRIGRRGDPAHGKSSASKWPCGRGRRADGGRDGASARLDAGRGGMRSHVWRYGRLAALTACRLGRPPAKRREKPTATIQLGPNRPIRRWLAMTHYVTVNGVQRRARPGGHRLLLHTMQAGRTGASCT